MVGPFLDEHIYQFRLLDADGNMLSQRKNLGERTAANTTNELASIW